MDLFPFRKFLINFETNSDFRAVSLQGRLIVKIWFVRFPQIQGVIDDAVNVMQFSRERRTINQSLPY